MQMQSIMTKKTSREASLNNFMPVIEGINNQIKFLRSMMVNIDDRSTRPVSNRVNEMRSTIVFGSVYPLQNSESAALFFCSR